MPERWNGLQWRGEPGHYEVYYVTLTDPASGVGLWIRYTMVAPLPETGEEATCSLWFMAMDPRDPAATKLGDAPEGIPSFFYQPSVILLGAIFLFVT